jgi:hypothetical protein
VIAQHHAWLRRPHVSRRRPGAAAACRCIKVPAGHLRAACDVIGALLAASHGIGGRHRQKKKRRAVAGVTYLAQRCSLAADRSGDLSRDENMNS